MRYNLIIILAGLVTGITASSVILQSSSDYVNFYHIYKLNDTEEHIICYSGMDYSGLCYYYDIQNRQENKSKTYNGKYWEQELIEAVTCSKAGNILSNPICNEYNKYENGEWNVV